MYKIHNSLNTNLYLIILSLKLGWFLFKLKKNKNQSSTIFFLGYLRLFKFNFKIKGFGFKWKYFLRLKTYKSTIYLKIGLTHRVALKIFSNNKCIIKKKRLTFFNRSYLYIRKNYHILFFCFQTFLYNKKGIYLKGTKFKQKLSKKKSKF